MPLRVRKKAMKTIHPAAYRQKGSFIIEAIISLVLFAVGLISLMVLSAQALNQVGQSKARNDASYMTGELLSEMWVSNTVSLDNWVARLRLLIPEAAGTVYLSNCDCVETDTATGNVCAGAASGTVTVANPQPVTVCVTWSDRKDPGTTRRYQASSTISRN